MQHLKGRMLSPYGLLEQKFFIEVIYKDTNQLVHFNTIWPQINFDCILSSWLIDSCWIPEEGIYRGLLELRTNGHKGIT